jgi:hypothetical protein
MSELKGKQGERFLKNMINKEKKKNNSQQTKTQTCLKSGVGSFCEVEQERTTSNFLKDKRIPIGEDKTADTNNWTLDKQIEELKWEDYIYERYISLDNIKLFLNKLKEEIDNAQEDYANLDWVSKEQVIDLINKRAGKGFSEGKE